MIDLKILRQQVELGASPARIVDLVEQMLADELTEVDRQLLRASRKTAPSSRIPSEVDPTLPFDGWYLKGDGHD